MEHHHSGSSGCCMAHCDHGARLCRRGSAFLIAAARPALRLGHRHARWICGTWVHSAFTSHAAARQSLCLGSSSEHLDAVRWLLRVSPVFTFLARRRVWRQCLGWFGVAAFLWHHRLSVVRVLPSVEDRSFALTRGAFLGMVGTMKTNWPPETMNEKVVQEDC